MRTTPRTEDEAKRASSRELIKQGWQDSTIKEAVEKTSKNNNPMIELLHGVRMPDGSERDLRDWLVDTDLGAEKLRSAVVAVDALDRYENGSIGADDFAGRPEVTKRPDFTHKRTNHELRRPCERYRAQP